MRMLGVMNYHWRRRWLEALLFAVLVTLVLVTTLVMTVPWMHTTTQMQVGPQGHVQINTLFSEATLSKNPNALSDYSNYAFLIMVFALLTLKRNRQFLVSLSISRWETLAGSFLFLVTMSAALTLLGGFIMPTLVRAVLWPLGFPIRGGWTLEALLIGNDAGFFSGLWWSLCLMVMIAGLSVLIGYIMLRWWKVVLIAFAVAIAGGIFFIKMVEWSSYVRDFAETLIDWIQWSANTALPAIQNFFARTSLNWLALQMMGVGVLSTALSYPVMRGMKVT